MIKKVLKIVGNVLAAAIIAVEIIMVLFIVVMKSSGGEPSIFGYKMYVIISESMEPEINKGDVIISKKYSGQKLKEGDVITYLGKENDLVGKTVTHKIIRVSEDQSEIETQGVANSTADPIIGPSDVKAVMIRKAVVIGAVYSIITTTWGFICFVILPMVIMIISEIVRLVKITRSGEDDDEEEDCKTE